MKTIFEQCDEKLKELRAQGFTGLGISVSDDPNVTDEEIAANILKFLNALPDAKVSQDGLNPEGLERLNDTVL